MRRARFLTRQHTALLVMALFFTLGWLLVYSEWTATSFSSLRRDPDMDESRDAAATVRRLLERGGDVLRQDGAPYPEEIFRVDWATRMPREDALHLGRLQNACTSHRNSVITRRTELLDRHARQPEEVLSVLRQCAAVDIYLPEGIRGQGYCEDAAAYVMYLHARMVPHWVFELELFDASANRTVRYHELCPRTPVLVFNHYWGGLREDASWPATKPLFLMPNIEMFELEAAHYWQADVILCKTAVCFEYLTNWFEQHGNAKLTQVLYTRHTTSDVALAALAAGEQENQRDRLKDFGSPLFVHTAGTSLYKGTDAVVGCWLQRPDLPMLHLYISEAFYDKGFRKVYDDAIRQRHNIELHLGTLDSVAFGELVAQSEFFLCLSIMEGYGHYINQARAAGGLVIAPDAPPR